MTWNDRIMIGDICGKYIASVSYRLVWDTVVHVTGAKETKLEARMLVALQILSIKHLDAETLEQLDNLQENLKWNHATAAIQDVGTARKVLGAKFADHTIVIVIGIVQSAAIKPQKERNVAAKKKLSMKIVNVRERRNRFKEKNRRDPRWHKLLLEYCDLCDELKRKPAKNLIEKLSVDALYELVELMKEKLNEA